MSKGRFVHIVANTTSTGSTQTVSIVSPFSPNSFHHESVSSLGWGSGVRGGLLGMNSCFIGAGLPVLTGVNHFDESGLLILIFLFHFFLNHFKTLWLFLFELMMACSRSNSATCIA